MRTDFEIFINNELKTTLKGGYLIGYDLIEVQQILEKYYFTLDTKSNREKIMSEILNSKAIKKHNRKEKLKEINEFSNR